MNRIIRLQRQVHEYAATDLLQQLKDYLQMQGTAYDDVMQRMLISARGVIEAYTSTSALPSTVILEWRVMEACKLVRLPFAPLASIESVDWRKCRLSTRPQVEGYDYEVEGDSISFYQCGTYILNYTTFASEDPVLFDAIMTQTAWRIQKRDEAVGNLAPHVKPMLNALNRSF